MTALHKWSGQYCGFISNERVFDKNANYLGWIENNGQVFRLNGEFWGELVEENYILRRTAMATPARRAIRATPARPAVRAICATRAARAPRAGFSDALADLS